MPRTKLPTATLPEAPELPTEEVEAVEALPAEDIEKKDLPPEYNVDNSITIDGERIEIKATKLQYQRSGVAGFYKVLKSMPLIYIFQLPDDYFDAKRTPTKCLMDWVSAVVDDPAFTKKHFDNMTSEDIYRLLDIFLRLNKIDEMEEQVKNRLAATTTG